jgi:predicted transcriptional regulator
MRLFKVNAVKEAAKEMANAMDLLTADLNELKKRYLNGHHDVQVQSGINVNLPEKKPNGTSNGSR